MRSAVIRAFVAASLGLFGIGAAPLAADAQQAGKVPRIGILAPSPPAARSHLHEAFLLGLRELGYVEGQNIALDYLSAEGKLERLPELAAELVRRKVDVIVGGPEPVIRAAKQATTSIPIVMVAAGDPVAAGFVASLARPGGNITGQTNLASGLSAKRLELLKEAAPTISRVAVLWNPDNPGVVPTLRETEAAARSLRIQLQPLEMRGPNPDLESAFRVATRGQAGALIMLDEPSSLHNRTRIAELATQKRFPAISPFREFVEAGGLMAYGPSLPDQFRRAATFVHKILKGAKPADLPVEQPMRFELVINLRTAKALGLTVPQSVLLRADQVIQ
jgi:putative ABC transport system substrate-binding protein